MNVYEKLNKVQTELKAPKSQYNNFGRYNYRNAEDILEALKPLLREVKAVITIQDDIKLVGDRYYVESVVTFTDAEKGESISSKAYAREELQKKGMDSSQLTGSTSSYARKYALNGLFAIDDTKDSDFNNQGQNQQPKQRVQQSGSCSMCNKQVNAQVQQFSMSKFNRVLCFDCQKKTR